MNENVCINESHLVGTVTNIEIKAIKDSIYYLISLSTERLSGTEDVLPVLIHTSILNFNIQSGDLISVTGEYRSRNVNKKLKLYVLAKEVNKAESSSKNEIRLVGYLCRQPKFRITPLGRKITELLIAVNRPDGKSDYIPCVAWGRNAEMISQYSTGMKLSITGRIQSRLYIKTTDAGEEHRICYEVSIANFE